MFFFSQVFSSEKEGLQVRIKLNKFRTAMPMGRLGFFPSFAVVKDKSGDWRMSADIDEAADILEYACLNHYWQGVLDAICVDMGIVG